MMDAGTANTLPTMPTMNVSQHVLSIGAGEILLSIGHSRNTIANEAGAAPQAKQFIEWFATLSLSPTTAEMLKRSLTAGLKIYEEQFGKIPMPKQDEPTVSNVSKR